VPIADCDGSGQSWTMFDGYYASSSGNSWPPARTSKFRSYKLNEAVASSNVLLLVEAPTNQNYQGNVTTPGGATKCRYTLQQYCVGNDGTETPVCVNGIHGYDASKPKGKWNYLFVDGHVDLMQDSETWGHAPNTTTPGGPRWWSYGPWTRRSDDD
jgi:prepilin-type processing-associated H-X9-DG protein